jgi:hypothetical protein
MPSYLVTITSTILVEAENEDEARVNAVEMFSFCSVDFDIEEICDDDF